jgi:hypothetical protein
MKPRPIPSEYTPVVEWLLPQLMPWRKMTIAIDGVDHGGKSSLGRFLAWQTGMPVIETDFTLIDGMKPPSGAGPLLPVHDAGLLRRLIEHRHGLGRPTLVEGIFVLRQLAAVGIDPDLLIEVQAPGVNGGWPEEFALYRRSHPRATKPDFVVTRQSYDA